MTVWDYYEEIGEADRSSLKESERALLAILDLRQEVNAGGFEGYFRYWGGNSAPTALAFLPDYLGQDWADLLAEAMAVLGPSYPADADARSAALDATEPWEALDDLFQRFLDLESSVDADEKLGSRLHYE